MCSSLFAGVLIAANQIGVDTTILTLAAGAVFFGTAASVALIASNGSRQVSAEVAAGRSIRRLIDIGDRIDTGTTAGKVIELHGVSVEVETVEGKRVLMPYTRLLEVELGIERSED